MLPRRRREEGNTLIEVLVAVVIFSVGIIGLLRALVTSMQSSGDLQYRTVASNLAEQEIGAMWVDRLNLGAHALANAAVPQLPNGSQTVTVAGNLVTITVTWQAPSSAVPSTYSVQATLASN